MMNTLMELLIALSGRTKCTWPDKNMAFSGYICGVFSQ